MEKKTGSILKQILESGETALYCQTCNLLFYKAKMTDHLANLSTTAAEWFNKAMLHQCENPDHNVVSVTMGMEVSIKLIMEPQMKALGATHQEFARYLKAQVTPPT